MVLIVCTVTFRPWSSVMDFRPELKGREDGEGKERRKDCFERRGDTTETAGDPEGITAAKPTNSGSVNIRIVVGLKFFPSLKVRFHPGSFCLRRRDNSSH